MLRVVLLLFFVCSSTGAAAQALPSAVTFTPRAGTFTGRQTVTLAAQGRAEIHYTLDGSLPTASSPVYRGAISLDRSTRLRAIAVIPGSDVYSPVATETYLRVHSDTEGFTSHLPIVLIHTFESRTLDPYGTEHVAAALQVLEPVSGTTRMVGRAAVDSRIGIHVRGATSRNFPKTQYAVELRADGDESDSAQPLLGLPRNADWVLSDPVVYDRALIRNALAFELSNRIGRYAPRTRFAEVFLVDDGGDVREGHFLGLFTLIERIDRDGDRVDVSRLPATATAAPALTGGFILRIDKGTPDFVAAGRWLQFVYPDAAEMRAEERRPQLDFITTYLNGFAQAASAADFRHPTTRQHYSEFIDVDAWIDHHIVNVLTKNVDGLRFSTYFHKDRGGLLAAGPVWDFDRSLGTPYDLRATQPAEWRAQTFNTSDYFNEGWWRWLFRDPEFRSRYRARFQALLNKEFAAESIERIVDGMVSQIGPAAERNLERWDRFPALNNSHAAEVALLKDFVRRRVAWIRTQLAEGF